MSVVKGFLNVINYVLIIYIYIYIYIYIFNIYINTIHTDIDECSEGISGCTQLCTNTIGSYRCSCQYGYQLGIDNHTCLGKIITHY